MKGIGVDIESVGRLENYIDNDLFLQKIFTKKEIDYCKKKANPAQHFAARFAGKEAVIKAVSSYKKFILKHKEIEITNEDNGAPIVEINNELLQANKILISLSHQENLAIAFVIVK
jgi:holo-[acyl-carrier protein] synthase